MASVLPFPRNELEPPAAPLAGGASVSFAPAFTGNDPAAVRSLGNGGVEVNFGPEESEAPPLDPEFTANLAEKLDESALSQIAMDVVEMVEVDLDSRKPWFERLAKGLELLGIINERDVKPTFDGASAAHHPLIAEAIVQFQARALAELVPPTGPAKGLVLGEKTREKEEQAQRVEDYMNYQLMVEDRNYFPEMDQLLFLVGSEGSEFKKVYHDPLSNRNVSRLVRAEDFVVPYGATTLSEAPRYTHVITLTQTEFKRMVEMGAYRDATLGMPTSVEAVGPTVVLQEAKNEAEGQVIVDRRDEDRPRTIYEMHIDYVLPGKAAEPDDDGDSDVAVPYIISVEKDTPCVLSIRRNWKPEDTLKKKRLHFVHYPFIRGTGFYGFGFVHMIGGLAKAATGVLRLIIDNGAFSALQGGFKSKDAKLPSNVTLSPGKWVDTDLTGEELQKCFYTPPFKDVPDAMFKVLGLITEMGQRYAGTMESVVGDAPNTGPVGTTVALIEQGSKVFSAIHKRMHFAQAEELQLLADLHFEHMPEEGYPYSVPGADRSIMRQDFDERVDVVPVSDPNIFSQTQRVAIAQAALELAKEAPQLYNLKQVHERALEALRVPSPEELLIDKTKIQRADPITENGMMLTGRGVRTYPDQDHMAHIQVHNGLLQILGSQQMLTPEAQQILQSAITAHVSEHVALHFQTQMAHAMGMPMMPVNYAAEEGEDVAPVLPPQLENAVAQKAAMAINQLLPPQMSPEQMKAQAQAQEGQQKMQIHAQESQAKVQLKAQTDQHAMALKQQEMATKQQMETQSQQFEQHLAQQKQAFEQQLAAEKTARELEMQQMKQAQEQMIERAIAAAEQRRAEQAHHHDRALDVANAAQEDVRAQDQHEADQALAEKRTEAELKIQQETAKANAKATAIKAKAAAKARPKPAK